MLSEKAFETKVKEYLHSQDCWVLKTWGGGMQRSGIPDLLVCCNGYFLGIELKAEKGKPSELQKWNIDKIHEADGYGIILYPDKFEEFKDLIRMLSIGKGSTARHLYENHWRRER